MLDRSRSGGGEGRRPSRSGSQGNVRPGVGRSFSRGTPRRGPLPRASGSQCCRSRSGSERRWASRSPPPGLSPPPSRSPLPSRSLPRSESPPRRRRERWHGRGSDREHSLEQRGGRVYWADKRRQGGGDGGGRWRDWKDDRGDRGDRRDRKRDDRHEPREPREPRGPGPKPEGCKTVWVGWTAEKPEDEAVIEFFKDCGTVTEVRCSERHRRGYFAHVQFEDTEAVDKAMQKTGVTFMDATIQLDYAYMDKVKAVGSEAANNRRYRPKSIKPTDGHTMWVGDIHIDAIEQDMIDIFQPCGKIEMICLQVNQLRNGQFGHVKFFETEAVDKAAELGGSKLKGVPIRVDYAEDKPVAAYRVGKERSHPDTPKPEGCRTVWVGGLSSECTEEMVREFFGKCGEIKEVRLGRGGKAGAAYCHLEFAETDAVDAAMKLSGERMDSAKVRLDYAANRSDGKGKGKDACKGGDQQGGGKGGPLPLPDGHMEMPPAGYHGGAPMGWHGHGPPPMGPGYPPQHHWHPGLPPPGYERGLPPPGWGRPPGPWGHHHAPMHAPPPSMAPTPGPQAGLARLTQVEDGSGKRDGSESGSDADAPPGNFERPSSPQAMALPDAVGPEGAPRQGPPHEVAPGRGVPGAWGGPPPPHSGPYHGPPPHVYPPRPPYGYYYGHGHYWDHYGRGPPLAHGPPRGYPPRDGPTGYYGGPPPPGSHGFYGRFDGPPPRGRDFLPPRGDYDHGPPPGSFGAPPRAPGPSGAPKRSRSQCSHYTYSSYSYSASPERNPDLAAPCGALAP